MYKTFRARNGIATKAKVRLMSAVMVSLVQDDLLDGGTALVVDEFMMVMSAVEQDMGDSERSI